MFPRIYGFHIFSFEKGVNRLRPVYNMPLPMTYDSMHDNDSKYLWFLYSFVCNKGDNLQLPVYQMLIPVSMKR